MDYRPPRSGSGAGQGDRPVPPRGPASARRVPPGSGRAEQRDQPGRQAPRPNRDAARDSRDGARPRPERRPEVPRQGARSPESRATPPRPGQGQQPRPSSQARSDRSDAPRPAAARAEARPESRTRVDLDRERPRARAASSGRPAARVRPRRTGAKAGVAVLSAAVLVVTGYYWRIADSFADGLTTADVIEAAGEKPADGATDILMVGMDSRTDAQGNPLSKEQLAMLNAGVADGVLNTDTLIMIRIPNDGGKAVGLSIPRDSYVSTAEFGKHKINSVYARAKLRARQQLQKEGLVDPQLEVKSNEIGAKALIDTIQKLTGAQIDHYAEVNLLGFYDITNAIGGIDVCLVKPVKDSFSGANFPAGPQTLQGAQALAFVRQRHGLPNGDIDRIKRQQVFMGGMARKVFSGDVLAPGSALLGQLQQAVTKSVVLDRNWDIMRFAQQMISVTGGNVGFQTIPHGRLDLPTPDDGSAVEVDPAEVKAFVGGLLGGGAPPAPGTGTGAPSETPQAAKPTVTVLNTTARSGLAAQVSKTLNDKGFKTGEAGTAAARAKSVIRYAKGEEAAGQAVADALGGDLAVEADANLSKGKVTVLIGKDFPESTDGFAGAPLLDLSPRLATLQQPGPECVN
ncbi:LCP family protein [Actinokineospora auranticolor]|uniref:LCP family protein required for cell wall assembly n=1 Tax=Actinokineospora auranticolor TaxID=155976 RepID=A0A2S6GUN3_9PSEU|nr:LCP family protein [Actinokineospora auranticolor]PPK68955.1 LCP family protein required for cell wall assembly [Actinokineospora auranticolor]